MSKWLYLSLTLAVISCQHSLRPVAPLEQRPLLHSLHQNSTIHKTLLKFRELEFKALDQNNDHELSYPETDYDSETFRTLDLNQNDTLSLEELQPDEERIATFENYLKQFYQTSKEIKPIKFVDSSISSAWCNAKPE